MADTMGNGPSMSDLARRVQRVEDRIDERTATVDMVRSVEKNCVDRIAATERLQEARELTMVASHQAMEARIGKLEASNSKLTFMLITAFLTMLVSIIMQILNSAGGHLHP
jgi:DNA-binding transcriptional regulator YbjK